MFTNENQDNINLSMRKDLNRAVANYVNFEPNIQKYFLKTNKGKRVLLEHTFNALLVNYSEYGKFQYCYHIDLVIVDGNSHYVVSTGKNEYPICKKTLQESLDWIMSDIDNLPD